MAYQAEVQITQHPVFHWWSWIRWAPGKRTVYGNGRASSWKEAVRGACRAMVADGIKGQVLIDKSVHTIGDVGGKESTDGQAT